MNTIPLGSAELCCPTCGRGDQFTQPGNVEDSTQITCIACNTCLTLGELKAANMDRLQRLAQETLARALGKALK